MVVKEDADTVGIVLWRHLLGAPCFRAGFCSKTIIPDSEEHPIASSRAVPKAVLRWIRAKPAVQEFAILENYKATRFFPKEIVVLKDVPVKLYLSRLHREHINLFKILPWLTSTEVILPGQIGVIEFVPDQLGEFEIRNVGHSFEAKLLVVECIEQAKQRIVDKGVKMLALIHSTDDSQVFPEKSLVVKDIPVKIFNITLMAEDRISVAPFYVPDDINVRPQEINSFDFTPDSVGEFPIRDELRGFAGTLLVEDAE